MPVGEVRDASEAEGPRAAAAFAPLLAEVLDAPLQSRELAPRLEELAEWAHDYHHGLDIVEAGARGLHAIAVGESGNSDAAARVLLACVRNNDRAARALWYAVPTLAHDALKAAQNASVSSDLPRRLLTLLAAAGWSPETSEDYSALAVVLESGAPGTTRAVLELASSGKIPVDSVSEWAKRFSTALRGADASFQLDELHTRQFARAISALGSLQQILEPEEYRLLNQWWSSESVTRKNPTDDDDQNDFNNWFRDVRFETLGNHLAQRIKGSLEDEL